MEMKEVYYLLFGDVICHRIHLATVRSFIFRTFIFLFGFFFLSLSVTP